MAMESDGLNKGHPIFRNEPSFREFNKTFEDADDTLFSFLNEVDAETLKEEQLQPAQVFISYNRIFAQRDPRTQQVVAQPVYDHSTQKLPYAFPNSQERHSSLSRAQQAACLRVLLAWQRNVEVDKADSVVWHATHIKRSSEEQLVQQRIFEYANTQKERIYEPMKQLVLCYSKWFADYIQQLLPTIPTASYATHSGLPQLPQCKAINVDEANMENIELLCRVGQVRLWPEIEIKQSELSSLRVRLERYACPAFEAKTLTQRLAAELKQRIAVADEDVFVLPLDAILMLLIPGAYIDLPTEMLVSIRDIPDSDFKSFEFQQPFAARHCGWHTNSRLLSQAYAAFAPSQWLQFNADASVSVIDEQLHQDEADNVEMPPQLDYKLHPIEETVPHIKQTKTNSALISWRLRNAEAEQGLQIYSSLSLAAVHDPWGKHPLGCHLFKLETKPECGCEVMSKYELLSAWLQLKLLQTEMGHCTRISLRDFIPLVEQPLQLAAVEQQLQDLYNISMPQQLCHLHEFLKLLRGVAPGEYLLRYTTKYKDKFLLCQPLMAPTAQSFNLKDLITGTTPSNIDFLTDSNCYLPIAPKLCSRLHEEQQLLPCAFPAKAKGVQRAKKKLKEETKPKLVQRIKSSLTKKPAPKKSKRRSQRQRKRDEAKAKEKEDKELDKFMCL
ncbi:little elongation complex subunit 2 [Drosophila nasuta]|uniref:little elongation complex subunit 2 n=1 Tax=Drosophila nasuta TaxID=42062 RepID=UPI00295F4C1F|nr:little elongation complex subunit 2 [Drosophila nasuta]